jgi:hypothetical protein
MRLLIALVVWAAAIAGAAAVSNVVADGIHNPPAGSSSTGSSSIGSSSSSGGSAAPDPSSIKSTDQASLFRTANFTRALGRVRASVGDGAGIDNFVVYPGYLSVTAIKGGSEVNVYVDAGGRVERTVSPGSAVGSSLFRLGQIKAVVPAALARRIATAAHIPESQLHYIVVESDSTSNKRLQWLVYTIQGSRVEYFVAPGATGPLLEYRANSSSGLQKVSG